MREIKFRAWHKEIKEMFYGVGIQGNMWLSRDSHYGGDFSTLMQFTGLKDKNGKEIYEGDVVEIYMLDGFTKGEVVWSKLRNGWVVELTETANCELSYVKKVIGNIYENPELIITGV